jgi:hypothetical protein
MTHPYRVKQRPRPILTAPQRAILEALVEHAPALGEDVCPRAVADKAGQRFGSAMLALRNLERQRLVIESPVEGDAEARWSPTLTGRAAVRRSPSPSAG